MAKVEADATYTDEELLKNLRQSYAEATAAKSHGQRGKMTVHQDLDTLWDQIRKLEAKIERSSGQSTVVLTRHSRR